MKPSEILPQYRLIIDCFDVLKAVNIGQWEQFSPPQRRGIGILGRWVIEKSFWSVIVARGQVPPLNVTLMQLYALSGMQLGTDGDLWLSQVDDQVTTDKEADDEEIYRTAFLFAKTVCETAHTVITILDLQKSKQGTSPK